MCDTVIVKCSLCIRHDTCHQTHSEVQPRVHLAQRGRLVWRRFALCAGRPRAVSRSQRCSSRCPTRDPLDASCAFRACPSPWPHVWEALRSGKPGPRLTWAASEAFAKDKGGRLLTLPEARAFLGGKALYPGEDQWCAVQLYRPGTSGRDWVQVRAANSVGV